MPVRNSSCISLVLILLAVVAANQSFSQEASVLKGSVKNSNGEILTGAAVGIVSLNRFTYTNDQGRFELTGVPAGTHQLLVRYIGHADLVQTVVVSNRKVIEVDLVITESSSELTEIVVVGKSETQLVKEQSIKAEVINTKALSTQPATMIELMNRSAGIRVRQTGGLGASANLMLNGFQDRGIKYFKDGIPMDYLGAGYNFALVPANMLERIEVYKGVLPVSLGADALGGGVNMVTKKSRMKHLEASYELASFNTHRASLNFFYKDTTHYTFAGADAFLNHSDNDYTVTVDVTDPDLGTQHKDDVKLFHNKFTHSYAEVYGGFTNTRWADELRIGVAGFWMDRQNQYGSRMSQPFGASTSRQYSVVPTLRYQKAFWDQRLVIDQFLEANTIHVEQVDTARGIYNWYGEFMPSDSRRGEVTVRGSLANTRFSYVTSRTNLSYRVAPSHKLEFNAVYVSSERVGHDPLGLTFTGSGLDVLSVPANYDKIVAGLGLESRFLDDRLVNNLIGKYYYSKIEALEGDYYGNEQHRNSTNKRWGVAEAVKLTLSNTSFVRLSAEAATRLPEQDEIFGDGNLHVSNFELKPERSVNVNLGYRTEKSGRYALELNSFYRVTHDLILNVPYNFLFNQNQNVDHVKGLGFETDVTVSILSWLRANGNFTYQDFRLFDTNNAATEGARQKNTPYFFANLGVNMGQSRLLNKKDRLQVYWFFTFVREYYLDYIPKDMEPDGFLGLWGRAKFDATNIIPNQSLHTAGLTYFPFDNTLSVALQVKNVFDAAIYDNFRIQNAGRSFHLKLTYNFQ